MFLERFFSSFGENIAMDLGTANTLLYTKSAGIAVNEPSVVAMDVQKGTVLAVGRAAKDFLGRTPQRIKAIRPMKDGVIADFEVTREMIAFFVRKVVKGFRIIKPTMAICIPTGITQVEKRAVIESGIDAGAREVLLIEEPMAAAIGANLPVLEPQGNLVLDIGGGTSEVAVITLSAISHYESVRVAGDVMDRAVQRYVRDVFRLEIGDNTAENVKKLIGCALPMPDAPVIEVSGKDISLGTPKVIRLTEGHVREALKEPIQTIIDAIFRALEKTPPELAGDIYRNGMLIAGGGALIRGLDLRIAEATKLKVVVDSEPLTTVLRGTARAMEDKARFGGVFIN